MLTMTDLFCGGGGSSTGGIQVPGVEIRMAANHWKLAVEVHNANHPDTDHAAVDLHMEDPRYFPRTDLLWASPECTKWSQANGSRPLPAIEEGLFEDPLSDEASLRSRLLMFDVLRFAEHHRYRAMTAENVVDIATQAKYRTAWHLWRHELAKLGYRHRVVSLNSMHAQAGGLPAPQSRDRIYIVCWRNGDTAPDLERALRPNAWCMKCAEVVEAQQAWKKGRTVGRYRQAYVYVHAACGTQVEPGWLPAAAAIDWTIQGTRIGDRDKPLADKTRRRIAAGIARYWSPFHIEAGGNQYDAADPKHRSYGDPNAYYRAWPVNEYLRVLHTAETKALAIPVEGRDGKQARPLGMPMRTQTTRLETAMVVPSGGTWNEDARTVDHPLRALTTREAYGLVTPLHVSMMGSSPTHLDGSARPVDRELRTLTAEGNNDYLLSPYSSGSGSARPISDPVGTLTTRDRYALIQRHNSSRGDGAEMVTPASEYLRTLTTKGHQSIVTPGDLEAADAQVDDCLFRMLEPHEVAAGMAFPPDYQWSGNRRERVRLAGNAVTPPAARDLIGTVADTLAA
ncbi:DNA cytosine methyltransferase [Nocardioidaceae bacterium SCSIO 66511]|nr:DNA cytosine methyltransferase [Nocardioidaceae bacterium SCSIO 66511]